MTNDLVLDALEMGIWQRKRAGHDLQGLIHHSDAGSQYTSIRYTDRLVEAGARPSIGSVGDSYDNALAESIIGLFKTELIHRKGPWRSLDAVEMATLEWVDWYNNRRIFSTIGDIPPAEAETHHYLTSNPLQPCRWENPASIEPHSAPNLLARYCRPHEEGKWRRK
jgi:putative transposase